MGIGIYHIWQSDAVHTDNQLRETRHAWISMRGQEREQQSYASWTWWESDNVQSKGIISRLIDENTLLEIGIITVTIDVNSQRPRFKNRTDLAWARVGWYAIKKDEKGDQGFEAWDV